MTTENRITNAEADRLVETGRMSWIDIGVISDNPFNARKHVDATDLVASVRALGVLQPIVVRPDIVVDTEQTYQLVAGSRRLAAARLAGVKTMPVFVRFLTDEQALEVTLAENVKRQDMNPIDEAAGYQRLVETSSAAAVAARIGQTESHVYRRLRLLDLEPWLRTALAEGRLSIGHAERLVRLPKAVRKDAADPDMGVVWRRSPLFEDETWTPTADDLQPLHVLDEYARRKTAIDPTSADTRHFQPDLSAEIDEVLPTPEGTAGDPGPSGMPTLVAVSEDPVARSHMGASKTEKIPLTPAHWREVTKAKDRCEHVQPAVVTHGGPYRLLEVCATRSCAKHFPPPKKAKASKTRQTEQNMRDDYKAQEEKRAAAKKDWDDLFAAVAGTLADHLKDVKMSAALVRLLIDTWDLKKITAAYGVALTDKTALQVLVLSTVNAYDRTSFLQTVKPWKFNLGAVETKLKAAAKKEKAS